MKTLDQFHIRGRSAIVTGAASGIGLAYVEAMAEAGAVVTMTDIDTQGLQREAERLSGLGYQVRTAVLDVVRQDYIRTARSKGLHEQVVIYRHMIRNALIPVVTILGPSLVALVTGSFIIETMFGFPGMGRAYVTAIGQRDYSMILGTTLIFVFLVSIANLTVDFIYVLIDPRIKLEK